MTAAAVVATALALLAGAAGAHAGMVDWPGPARLAAAATSLAPSDSLVEPAVPAPAAPGPARPGAPARVGRLVTNLASDLWHVASSPARLDARGAIGVAGVAGVAALIYSADQEILDAFHRAEGHLLYDAAVGTGELLDPVGFSARTTPWYLLAAAAAPPLRKPVLDVLESHIVSGLIRESTQYLVGHRRPYEGYGHREFGVRGASSFPSGHTSAAFQIATVLSHHARRPPATALFYTLAAAVALERIAHDEHWTSDVFLSAIEGTLVARTVVRRNAERRAAAGLALGVGPGRAGLAARF